MKLTTMKSRAVTGGIGEQMAQQRRDREMSRIGFPAALLAASLLCIAPAAGQIEGGRAAALD